jgi:hypothetical protein
MAIEVIEGDIKDALHTPTVLALVLKRPLLNVREAALRSY